MGMVSCVQEGGRTHDGRGASIDCHPGAGVGRGRLVLRAGIDFSPNQEGIQHLPLDKETSQYIEDVTPQ
jgi:hypothetical protein